MVMDFSLIAVYFSRHVVADGAFSLKPFGTTVF